MDLGEHDKNSLGAINRPANNTINRPINKPCQRLMIHEQSTSIRMPLIRRLEEGVVSPNQKLVIAQQQR
jgi:translation elongation factor EF-1alpha